MQKTHKDKTIAHNVITTLTEYNAKKHRV